VLQKYKKIGACVAGNRKKNVPTIILQNNLKEEFVVMKKHHQQVLQYKIMKKIIKN